VPASQVVFQGAQSITVEPLSVAVPVELQKPDLQTHAVMSEPPGEAFEFAGQAMQVVPPFGGMYCDGAYVPVPHAVHELNKATEDNCQ